MNKMTTLSNNSSPFCYPLKYNIIKDHNGVPQLTFNDMFFYKHQLEYDIIKGIFNDSTIIPDYFCITSNVVNDDRDINMFLRMKYFYVANNQPKKLFYDDYLNLPQSIIDLYLASVRQSKACSQQVRTIYDISNMRI